jgi:hypothetical protein
MCSSAVISGIADAFSVPNVRMLAAEKDESLYDWKIYPTCQMQPMKLLLVEHETARDTRSVDWHFTVTSLASVYLHATAKESERPVVVCCLLLHGSLGHRVVL